MTLELKYSIRNKMEEVAELAIWRVLSEEKDACTCPLCVSDMKALVLNSLQPDYVPANEEEREPIRLETLPRDLFNQVMVESYKAMALVKAKPRHERKRSPLHNGAEEILLLALQEILPGQEERWREPKRLSAVMARALNGMKPNYSTTHKGRVYSRVAEIDPGHLAQVYAVIYNAFTDLGKEEKQKA